MKVLQINSVCGYGSTGKIVIDLYKMIKENAHECLIAYGRKSAPKEIEAIRIGNTWDNYVHVAMTRLFDKHGFASTKATKKFLQEIDEINPDIIHLHNIHGYYINIKLLFNWLQKVHKPVIWTLHDCWAFTGHCTYFDNVSCDRWKTACQNCPQKASYPKSWFLDGSKSNFKKKQELFTSIDNLTVVTPSKWLAELVKESFIKRYDVRVIYNGIDLNVFKPRDKDTFRKKYGIENKFIILGVASIWDERKGLKYFLELADLIDSDSIIVLVGLNNKQLKHMPNNVIGIKRTSNADELAEIYSSADVFVNPTLEDNFPTVNLEALACGTPVITFDTGGSPECLDDRTGFIVKKGDTMELLRRINEIRDNKIDSFDCIKRAAMFDKNKNYNEYMKLYLETSQG
ncbi:MAG: glycosyltransferase [Thermoanaerobacteraceae bacterium]|nr:glycosyltransferase [Thermoanaerobacteraceae bacterium]